MNEFHLILSNPHFACRLRRPRSEARLNLSKIRLIHKYTIQSKDPICAKFGEDAIKVIPCLRLIAEDRSRLAIYSHNIPLLKEYTVDIEYKGQKKIEEEEQDPIQADQVESTQGKEPLSELCKENITKAQDSVADKVSQNASCKSLCAVVKKGEYVVWRYEVERESFDGQTIVKLSSGETKNDKALRSFVLKKIIQNQFEIKAGHSLVERRLEMFPSIDLSSLSPAKQFIFTKAFLNLKHCEPSLCIELAGVINSNFTNTSLSELVDVIYIQSAHNSVYFLTLTKTDEKEEEEATLSVVKVKLLANPQIEILNIKTFPMAFHLRRTPPNISFCVKDLKTLHMVTLVTKPEEYIEIAMRQSFPMRIICRYTITSHMDDDTKKIFQNAMSRRSLWRTFIQQLAANKTHLMLAGGYYASILYCIVARHDGKEGFAELLNLGQELALKSDHEIAHLCCIKGILMWVIFHPTLYRQTVVGFYKGKPQILKNKLDDFAKLKNIMDPLDNPWSQLDCLHFSQIKDKPYLAKWSIVELSKKELEEELVRNEEKDQQKSSKTQSLSPFRLSCTNLLWAF